VSELCCSELLNEDNEVNPSIKAAVFMKNKEETILNSSIEAGVISILQ
jgi:hypothetical protein